MLFDFRYRGESEGDAQTLGVKESWDIQSAVDYLKERPDVDAERIGVQGGSLGAASAILAAAEKSEIKGVVAQIPFASINPGLGLCALNSEDKKKSGPPEVVRGPAHL